MVDRRWHSELARDSRQHPTSSASLLWMALRRSRLGVRFRREDPIGPFIADFSCRSRRLVIEVDGDSHDDPERDAARDRWFACEGWTVLRFKGFEVLEDVEAVVHAVRTALGLLPGSERAPR